jgi:hypothetical protein
MTVGRSSNKSADVPFSSAINRLGGSRICGSPRMAMTFDATGPVKLLNVDL